MATLRPFTYNPSPNPLIPGTEQVGELAIGIPTSGFTNSPTFWNGPDEDLGYVICYPVPAGNHPTPIPGVFSYVGFLGTKNMANPFFESTFLELVNTRFNQNFTSGNQWIAGGLGTNQVATSSDGLTWSPTVNGNTVFSSRVQALTVKETI